MQFEEKDIDILDIIRFLIRNRKIIVSTTLVSFFLGVIFALLQKKTYTVEAAIMVLGIKPIVNLEPKIQIKDLGDNFFQQYEERKKTVVELLNSPFIISEVIEKLQQKGLIKSGEFTVKDFTARKTLTVETKGEIIKVKVKLSNKNLAKSFADEMVQTVTEKMYSLTTYHISRETLTNKLQETKKEYQKAQQRYNYFVQNNRIMEIEKKINQLKEIYSYYIANITNIEKIIWDAKGLKEQIQKSEVSSVGEFANALALLKFKSSVFIKGESPLLNIEVKESSKDMLRFQDTKSAVKEIDGIIEILERQKNNYEQKLKEEKYEQQIQELQKELEKEKDKEKELLKDKELLWESILTLERKQKELDIVNGISENIPVKIAYLSNLPEKPDDGKRKLIVGLYTLIGFSLGVGIGLLKEVALLLK